MKLSDLSIKRPVFAVVMSLLLIVLGVMSFSRLTLRELPAIDPPIVSVIGRLPRRFGRGGRDPHHPGAGGRAVGHRGRRHHRVAQRPTAARNISIEFNLSRDIEAAANDVRDAVSRVVDRLPEEAEPPEIAKVESDSDPIIWLNMSSSTMDTLQLSDYAERYVVDRLSSIDGVAQVRIGGQQRYAMRVWLDRDAMAARGLTVSDIENALSRRERGTAGRPHRIGRPRLHPARGARLPEAGGLRADSAGQGRRRLRGAAGRRGQGGAGFGRAPRLLPQQRRAQHRPGHRQDLHRQQPGRGPRRARSRPRRIQPSLPEGTDIFVAFDTTTFIDAAVDRVYETLVEAIVLVLLVIWLFLGSVRAALIPAVTVPVCLIAAFIALYAFGFSINLLTLLALVLCIGLVVDDAIVVVENIQRRVDLGEPPLVAAARGTEQVAFAVIATTAVLVAVFLPVGFLEGNTGPPVPRAVGGAGRRGGDFGLRRADADADDVFEAVAGRIRRTNRAGTSPTGSARWVNRQLDKVSRTATGARWSRPCTAPGCSAA